MMRPACKRSRRHDSHFVTAKLVSRLRKSNTVETTAGATTLAGATSPSATHITAGPTSNSDEASQLSPTEADTPAFETTTVRPKNNPGTVAKNLPAQQDRFFILKSLTLEDLELSVTTGIWATQSHNEEILNKAYQTAQNVYLVFSANKSGEYFGYARMVSEIDNDPAAAIEFAPKAQTADSINQPNATIIAATDLVPRGRIIDDSARGTVFWEVYSEDIASGSGENSDAGSTQSGGGDEEEEGDGKSWGKPFKLQWMSTTRLLFYRTRGLRNPWNSNREVKIARDGTELEPSVGRKLIGLFNRPQGQPQPFPPMGRPPAGMHPAYQP